MTQNSKGTKEYVSSLPSTPVHPAFVPRGNQFSVSYCSCCRWSMCITHIIIIFSFLKKNSSRVYTMTGLLLFPFSDISWCLSWNRTEQLPHCFLTAWRSTAISWDFEAPQESQTLMRMTKLRRLIISSTGVGRRWGATETLIHSWWGWEVVQTLLKTVWPFFKKVKYVFTIWPNGSTPGYLYRSNESTYPYKDLFIATLFLTAPNWKQPTRPSTGEWINKFWTALQWSTWLQPKRNGRMIDTTSRINLTKITLNERRQSTYWMSPFI